MESSSPTVDISLQDINMGGLAPINFFLTVVTALAKEQVRGY